MPGEDLFEQATELHKAGKFGDAEKLYDLLLTQNHDNAGLLATLGTMYLQMQKPGLAMTLLHRSAEKSKQSDVMCNLGLAYKYSGQPEKAEEWMRKAVEHPKPTAEAMANYGGLFVEAPHLDKTQRLLEKAIEISPELALGHWNLSLVLLAQGQWDRAWDEHEWGITSGMRVDRGEVWGVPVWDGSPGKRVIVYGEQGMGDEIMFASMLPDVLKTNEVIFECHERLVTLFQKSFPGVTVYGTREDPEPQWPAHEKADARISIGSLGKFYRRTKESFPGTPYLKAESAPRGDKFRVGISWTGGKKTGRVLKRSVPLSWWKTILHNRCEFVSLQYTDCADEIELVEKDGYKVRQFDEVKAHDYYETAKLVQSCDLVISVCTSVIHLAGALGVPCWVLTPFAPAWRYQHQGRMPFYKSVRLYRQPTPKTDSWIQVVQKIGLDLQDLLDERKAA